MEMKTVISQSVIYVILQIRNPENYEYYQKSAPSIINSLINQYSSTFRIFLFAGDIFEPYICITLKETDNVFKESRFRSSAGRALHF